MIPERALSRKLEGQLEVNSDFSVMGDLWKMNPCLPAAPVIISNPNNGGFIIRNRHAG